jgi:hypothetical protein
LSWAANLIRAREKYSISSRTLYVQESQPLGREPRPAPWTMHAVE